MNAVPKTSASAPPLLAESTRQTEVERRQGSNEPRFLPFRFRKRRDSLLSRRSPAGKKFESFTPAATRATHLTNYCSLAPNVPIAILGVSFDNVTTSETMTLIEGMI